MSFLVAGTIIGALALTVGIGASVLTDNPVVLVATAIVVAIVAWLAAPAPAGRAPRLIALFLVAMAFSTALPTQLAFVLQGFALLGSYLAWLSIPGASRRGAVVVAWVTIIIVFWAVLIFHANVPSIEIGLLGFRKTVFCLSGLVAGLSIPQRHRDRVGISAAKALGFAVAISIALHLFAPSVEQSINRAAGEYTALLAGESRLQGIFAGPFHAATGCLILIVWAVVFFKSHRLLASVLGLLGLVGMYLTLARTAYVALAIAITVIILSAPTAGKVVKRILVVFLIAVAALWAATIVSPTILSVVQSIGDYSTDNRFLGRFPGYAEGLELFSRSPIFGWGSGSAGDTLETAFVAGSHITSHNILLKILVEGGLIGFAMWVGLGIAIWRGLPRRTPRATNALGAVAVLLGMGLTGSSLETLPLTWFIFLFVGLAVQSTPNNTKLPTRPNLEVEKVG